MGFTAENRNRMLVCSGLTYSNASTRYESQMARAFKDQRFNKYVLHSLTVNQFLDRMVKYRVRYIHIYLLASIISRA